jgi:hypothetical protein
LSDSDEHGSSPSVTSLASPNYDVILQRVIEAAVRCHVHAKAVCATRFASSCNARTPANFLSSPVFVSAYENSKQVQSNQVQALFSYCSKLYVLQPQDFTSVRRCCSWGEEFPSQTQKHAARQQKRQDVVVSALTKCSLQALNKHANILHTKKNTLTQDPILVLYNGKRFCACTFERSDSALLFRI